MVIEMRNSKRRLSDEMAADILEKGLYGVLSTVDAGGMPYGVPMSYALAGNSVYFHCAPEGHKLNNIEFSSKACFTVVCDVETLAEKFSTKYKSVVAFGSVAVVENAEEKRRGIEAIMMKYSSDFAAAGEEYIARAFDKFVILRFDVESMSGKGRLE